MMEIEMATHSSTLAWKIPWMEEFGRLQSIGSWRVGHDWATSCSLFTFMHWRRKWQPTPVFLPGESQGLGSLVGCRLWGHTKLDTAEVSGTRLKWLSSSSRKRWKSTDSWNYILKESYPIRNIALDLMLVKKNLFLYMYTYTYICMCMYMYMYTYSICTYVYVSMHTWRPLFSYIYIYTYLSIYVQSHRYMHFYLQQVTEIMRRHSFWW